MQLTTMFKRMSLTLPEERAEPSAPEPAVHYRETDDGPIDEFENSDKAKKVRAQCRAGVQKLKQFLLDNSKSSRTSAALESLDNFSDAVSAGINGPFDARIGTIYDHGKRALDALCVDVDDAAIPLDKRLSVVENLTEGLNVCAPGACTNLMIATDELRMSVFGLKGHAKKAWDNLFDQTILQFCKRLHAKEAAYPAYEIHYVNGYRNEMATLLGLTPREDALIPAAWKMHYVEARRFVKDALTADALVRYLAEECLAEVRSHFSGYIDRPLTEAEAWQVYTRYTESLELGLHNRYGRIDCSILINAWARNGNPDAPYTIIEHTALLVRAIARNLKEAGLLKKEKFRVEASEGNDRKRIKRISEDIFYVKEKHDDGEVSYRNVELDDAHAGLSRATQLAIFKSALTSKPDREQLRLLDPQGPWVKNSGQTAFHWAGILGNPNILGALRSSVGDIDEPSRDGNTALTLAALHGNLDAVNKLLELGARPNHGNAKTGTILHYAAAGGNPDVIELLKHSPGSIDEPDDIGSTALMIAALHGKLKAVHKLLELGAWMNSADAEGKNCSHYAAAGGNPDVIKMMLDRSPGSADERDHNDDTPLMIAAYAANLDAVRTLLERGARPHLGNIEGKTSLHFAAEGGNPEIIQLLMTSRVDIDEPTNDGCTPLMMAACAGRADAVRTLLDLGAVSSFETPGAVTAFHLAGVGGNPTVIELLKDSVGSVDTPTANGDTALMIAAEHGNFDAARKLLELGAEASLRNMAGKTPLDIAADLGRRDILELLQTCLPGKAQ
ncbi:MAG TPA: ankyrin repeat domain-containing protein [Burkholderiaceae bacterium]|nr:ankyrin repeat domain-containing protein [Burkholderiaceae bacterium]